MVDRGKPGVEWWMIYLLHKTERLQEVEGGDSSTASFIASVEESISERECKLYAEGVKLSYLCIGRLVRR